LATTWVTCQHGCPNYYARQRELAGFDFVDNQTSASALADAAETWLEENDSEGLVILVLVIVWQVLGSL
jgi:hypothetical protein